MNWDCLYSSKCLEGEFSEVRVLGVLGSRVLDLDAPHEPQHHQEGRRQPKPSQPYHRADRKAARCVGEASPPSFGFSPFASTVRSAPAFESSLVSLQRSTLRPFLPSA